MRLLQARVLLTALLFTAIGGAAFAGENNHMNAGELLRDQGIPQTVNPAGLSHTSVLEARGRVLYTTHCASCHGADLAGTPGVPSLQHAGGAAVDFYLTTGRMPGVKTNVQSVHAEPHFNPQDIAALDAYVGSVAKSSLPIPIVAGDKRFLADGRHLFEENCEACHGAAGEGATTGGIWTALPLDKANPTQIGEAIRVGPGMMPRFTPALLSDRDIDALATYIGYLDTGKQDYGGLTMDYLGPLAEGAIGAVVGVGALFWVIFFTGTKADGSRLHK